MSAHLRGVRGFVTGIVVASVLGAGGLAVVRATTGSSSASSFVPVAPVRVLDTRSDLGLVAVTDGVAGILKVTGSIPTATSTGIVNAVVVPAGATAVVLNVTAVNPTAGGYVSLRPGDATGAPTVSTLNVTAGGTFPNGATITVPTTGPHAGEIQVWYEAEYTTVGSTELLIDIAGYYELASSGSSTPEFSYKIGDTGPGGGHIFFVDYNDQYAGFNYLEAAPLGCESELGWSPGALAVIAARGWSASAVGQGQTNTTAIVAVNTSDTASNNAAKYADSLNCGSKTDWFLGSIGEMSLMYTNLRQSGVGGFSTGNYWSSTEKGDSQAWNQVFNYGFVGDGDYKYNQNYVRPVRAF